MLAACLQLVAHTNKSSDHLILVELQPCYMFSGRRDLAAARNYKK